MSRVSSRLRLGCAVAALLLTACSEDPASAPMIGSVQLDVTAPVSLEVGDTYTLTARALDTGGTVLPTVLFVWSTSDAEVATVTAGTGSTGIVSAIGVGTARITAAAAGRTATVDVIVTAAADPTDGGG